MRAIPYDAIRSEESEPRRSPQEIVDVHLRLRKLRSSGSRSESIVCLLSESEDSQQGPWRFTTASEVVTKEPCMELASLFAVEFLLFQYRYIRLDM